MVFAECSAYFHAWSSGDHALTLSSDVGCLSPSRVPGFGIQTLACIVGLSGRQRTWQCQSEVVEEKGILKGKDPS